MTLCVEVLAVDFDTEGCSLRVKGKNVEENPYVKVGHDGEEGGMSNKLETYVIPRTNHKRAAWPVGRRRSTACPPHTIFHLPWQLGQHHTIEMELNRKFSLFKAEWDSVALDRVGMCVSVSQQRCQPPLALFFKFLVATCLCSRQYPPACRGGVRPQQIRRRGCCRDGHW